MQGWGFNKTLLVKMADEDSMYIIDPSTNLCLTGSDKSNQGVTYWAKCIAKSQWIRYGNNTFENKFYRNTYLSFYIDGEWKGSPYGLIRNVDLFNYKYWKMESHPNRWSIYDL